MLFKTSSRCSNYKSNNRSSGIHSDTIILIDMMSLSLCHNIKDGEDMVLIGRQHV